MEIPPLSSSFLSYISLPLVGLCSSWSINAMNFDSLSLFFIYYLHSVLCGISQNKHSSLAFYVCALPGLRFLQMMASRNVKTRLEHAFAFLLAASGGRIAGVGHQVLKSVASC